MSTIEIKQELYKFIDTGDEGLLNMLYEKAKAYQEQLEKDEMIAEAEADIEAGRTYNLEEANSPFPLILPGPPLTMEVL